MSNTELPRLVDPSKLAEQSVSLEGVVPLRSLPRFAEVLHDPEGEVSVVLQFGRDPEKRRIIEGRLNTSVVLECQRCMSALRTTLSSDFVLGLVISDDQARQLPREYEPFLMKDFEADLWQMVEDELLLAVPPFPLHEREECPASEALEEFERADEVVGSEEPEKRENPFSVLAELKKKDQH